MRFVLPPKPLAGVAVATLLFATGLSGCAGSSESYSPATSNQAASAVRAVTHAALATWSRNLMRVPLPSAGCFTASYPAFTWSRVACVAPPKVLFPPAFRNGTVQPAVIGNGADYTIVTSPSLTSSAVGSFPSVSGVQSVRSVGVPAFGGHGVSGPNVYSLQLNSNTFPTAACAGMAHCLGWEQFVFTNQPAIYKGGGNIIIQDWLLSSTSKRLSGCPKHAGWQRSDGSCVQNGPASVATPNIPITDLSEVSLSGSASSSGDSAFLTVGSTMYGMKNIQGDGITDLVAHWTGSEFNVVGNGGGSRARFNAGSTITVSVQADDGSTSAPACEANSGTTGESNNLVFVAPPANPAMQNYPSITFTESNAGGGGTGSCDALSAL